MTGPKEASPEEASPEEAIPEAVARAAHLIAGGSVVAFPTETVYGLGADASNDGAVRAVYEIKARAPSNPLIVHCADQEHVAAIAEMTPVAAALARAFWPGPLTMVLTVLARSSVCARVRAGADTVAVRVPSHPVARALIRAAGVAIAAPSANPSGQISPTSAAHVAGDFAHSGIAMILDAGVSQTGIESSIVDVRAAPVRLLRPGAVSRERIAAVVGALACASAADTPITPGRVGRHYAPREQIRLDVAYPPRAGESYLAFGPLATRAGVGGQVVNLSLTGNIAEAAGNLFAMLRRLDRLGCPIAVAPIPHTGLGEAINDRLARAAGAKR